MSGKRYEKEPAGLRLTPLLAERYGTGRQEGPLVTGLLAERYGPVLPDHRNPSRNEPKGDLDALAAEMHYRRGRATGRTASATAASDASHPEPGE